MGHDGADGIPGPNYPTGSESVQKNKNRWSERTETLIGSKSSLE